MRCARAASSIRGASSIRASPTRGRSAGCATPACASIRSGTTRDTAQVQGEIWQGQCPQCWTACEAYQSILGNALAFRRPAPARPVAGDGRPAADGARAMNVACFADAVTRARLDRAVTHHVAATCRWSSPPSRKRRASAASSIGRGATPSEIVVVVGRSTDGTADVAAQSGASVLADGGRGKGEAIRRAIPHIRTPVTVFLDADGSHDPEDIPLLVEPILRGRGRSRRRRRACAAARASCTAASTSSSGWPAARSSPPASTGGSTAG